MLHAARLFIEVVSISLLARAQCVILIGVTVCLLNICEMWFAQLAAFAILSAKWFLPMGSYVLFTSLISLFPCYTFLKMKTAAKYSTLHPYLPRKTYDLWVYCLSFFLYPQNIGSCPRRRGEIIKIYGSACYACLIGPAHCRLGHKNIIPPYMGFPVLYTIISSALLIILAVRQGRKSNWVGKELK